MPQIDMPLPELRLYQGVNPRPADHDAYWDRAVAEMRAIEPRVRRAFAVYPFLSDYRRVWDMDLAKGAYEELAWYFRSFDPLHAREEQIFTTLGYIDVQHLAPRISAETRMAVGLMDEICPPSTQFAAYNRMKCPKDLVIYPDYSHEWLPGVDDMIYDYFAALQAERV